MLPGDPRRAFTCGRILMYAVALVGVTVLPFLIGMSGWPYLIGALALGGRFIWFAWKLRHDATLAMASFRYSIVYLFGLFTLLLADHYLQAVAG
jgi:protoheme IX farnesyltransferase